MGIAPASGAEFFPLLVHHLARALGVDCALVGEIQGTGAACLSSLTINLHGKLAGSFEYRIAGSPLEGIGNEGFVCFPREAHRKFPGDQFLAEMGFESCAAVPLRDSEGSLAGIMAVMDAEEMEDYDQVREILDFLAPRVGAEIERRRHEDALRFTQFSVDRSGDASFWMGSDARFIYVNDAACQSLGYTREELLTMSVPDIDPLHTAEEWPETWQGVRAGTTDTFESVHTRKDGTRFPVEIAVNYLEFGGKEYNCAFARDISARKRAEALVSGQSRVLEKIAKGAPLDDTLAALCLLIEEQSPGASSGICLPDQGGKTLSHAAGPGLSDRFAEAVVGIPIAEGAGPCGTAAHRKELVAVEDVETDPICTEFRDHLLSHGFRACWSSPVFSSSGNILGTFALYYGEKRLPDSDESKLIQTASQIAGIAIERKEAEEALRRSSERFRQLIERMPEGMVVHRFGPIVYANPKAASAIGYDTPDEMIGLSVVDLVAPEIREAARERVERMRETGRPDPAREMYLRRKDGRSTIAEMESIPIDFDGAPAVLAIARDITERKRMQARLLQADRMASVGTLAAGVAHEINNPLAYVITNLDYLVEELPGMVKSLGRDAALRESSPPGEENGGVPGRLAERIDDIEQTLQEAREGAERVRQIVRDLRTFSRDGDEERGPVDAQHVLESSINMAWSEIRKRAELVRDYRPTPPVHATESRLGQVFLNLLLNAAQAIPEDRPGENQIRVSTAPIGGDRVLIEVRDTGMGIPRENLDRIFQPFFTTKPVGIGTGLGLSICQNIITAMDGELTVRSEAGRYTCFRLLLPVSSETGESEPLDL
ncbi:MAG: PAS domain S-box protein [Myxococcota bacterium]